MSLYCSVEEANRADQFGQKPSYANTFAMECPASAYFKNDFANTSSTLCQRNIEKPSPLGHSPAAIVTMGFGADANHNILGITK